MNSLLDNRLGAQLKFFITLVLDPTITKGSPFLIFDGSILKSGFKSRSYSSSFARSISFLGYPLHTL